MRISKASIFSEEVLLYNRQVRWSIAVVQLGWEVRKYIIRASLISTNRCRVRLGYN